MNFINALKSRLSTNNTLTVQNERGFIMETEFKWNPPAKEMEITSFEKKMNIVLPKSYKDFLKITDGAVLFKDKQYGQWGCKLYGISELIEINEQARSWRSLKDSWLVFATWLGDQDFLLFDLKKYESGEKKYIIDGDEGDSEDEFEYIKGDFEKWLDRLIVAQGAKYWRW